MKPSISVAFATLLLTASGAAEDAPHHFTAKPWNAEVPETSFLETFDDPVLLLDRPGDEGEEPTAGWYPILRQSASGPVESPPRTFEAHDGILRFVSGEASPSGRALAIPYSDSASIDLFLPGEGAGATGEIRFLANPDEHGGGRYGIAVGWTEATEGDGAGEPVWQVRVHGIEAVAVVPASLGFDRWMRLEIRLAPLTGLVTFLIDDEIVAEGAPDPVDDPSFAGGFPGSAGGGDDPVGDDPVGDDPVEDDGGDPLGDREEKWDDDPDDRYNWDGGGLPYVFLPGIMEIALVADHGGEERGDSDASPEEPAAVEAAFDNLSLSSYPFYVEIAYAFLRGGRGGWGVPHARPDLSVGRTSAKSAQRGIGVYSASPKQQTLRLSQPPQLPAVFAFHLTNAGRRAANFTLRSRGGDAKHLGTTVHALTKGGRKNVTASLRKGIVLPLKPRETLRFACRSKIALRPLAVRSAARSARLSGTFVLKARSATRPSHADSAAAFVSFARKAAARPPARPPFGLRR